MPHAALSYPPFLQGCARWRRMVCERAMPFSERFCAGFALAATVAGDRNAELASGGLSADIAPPLLDTMRALSALSKKERRDRVRAFLMPQALRLPAQPEEPLRAYTLLAQGTGAQALPAWLRAAPLPRAGYTAPPELVALLRRMTTADG